MKSTSYEAPHGREAMSALELAPEVSDGGVDLEELILRDLTDKPVGVPTSPLFLAWLFAKERGVLWREDTGLYDRLWAQDGEVRVTTMTKWQVRKLAIEWVGEIANKLAQDHVNLLRVFEGYPRNKQLDELKRLIGLLMIFSGGSEGIHRKALAVVKCLPDVSKRGRPGENKFESFLRRWVDDYHRDGLRAVRPVARHEGLSSELLLTLFRLENPNYANWSNHRLFANLKAGMKIVFPNAPWTKHLWVPTGRGEARGYEGVRLRVALPDGFEHKHAPDAPDCL
jgi:hypothetical protein